MRGKPLLRPGGLASRIADGTARLVRAALAEPPRPPLPGASLEPGFRRRWLWFFLPGAFIFFWLLNLALGFNWQIVGFDGHIYYHGSAAWLAGQNPWATGAVLNGFPFSYAGLPPTVILLSPLTLLGEQAFVWLWLGISFASAIVIVRALRLPILWVAYPPLLQGVLAANPHVLLLALLVAGGTWAGVLASVIKIVAIAPLVGERRWRALLLAAAALGLSVVLFPGLWSSFLDQAGAVQNIINAESRGGLSAWGRPYLLIPIVISLGVLALIDGRAAAWLVVPALFPTTQYYYAMFALPLDPFLAAAMAFPAQFVPPLVTIGYTAVRVGRVMWRRSGRTPRLTDPIPSSQPGPGRDSTIENVSAQ